MISSPRRSRYTPRISALIALLTCFTFATAASARGIDPVSITKSFTNDPAPDGGTVQLEFTITNGDRDFQATAITFTDDLNAVLTGLQATGLPVANVCGAGSTLSGTSVITLTGGTLESNGASCTFSVTLNIPSGTAPGPYLNTTSQVSGLLNGSPFTGAPATDTLTVEAATVVAPTLRKSFVDDPALPGGTVTLEFTLNLSESASTAATNISFTDDLTATLAGLVATGLPQNDVCGAGSQISGTGLLTFTGGTVAPGSSCTFSVDLTVPAAAAPGSYPNTTSNVMATVASTPVVGGTGSDNLSVVGIALSKSFLDDPVLPGGTVTLEFTIVNADPSFAATNITFTDDLNAALTGLVATGLPLADVCGVGSSLSGTSTITLTGGQLAAGGTCTFAVSLTVPGAAADGTYLNVTSNLTATVNAVGVISPPATDPLVVSSELLLLRKTFTNDPVPPGGTVTLEFTIDNLANQPVTAISFTDDLNAALSGLVATGLPQNNLCGAGSSLSGTSLLSFSGGSLPAGGSCTFSVSLNVPATVGVATAVNTTSGVTGMLGALAVTGSPATDTLTVQLAAFSKSFSGPAQAGDIVTLTFTLENLSTTATLDNLSFTDDLGAALAGLSALGLPQNDPCGDTSQLSGTTVLSFLRGGLPPGGSCSIVVQVQVPASATPGVYTNVTSPLLQQGTGNVATPAEADLLVVAPPSFSKNFLSSPTLPGGSLQLQYTISNTTSLNLISLQFTDDFSVALPGLVAVGLPANGICGGGSAISGSGLVTLTGGSLAANASCTFTIDLQVPTSATPGTFTSTTGVLSYGATNLLAGRGLEAGTASADFTVATLVFSKTFAESQVMAGSSATLSFTLSNPDPVNGATAITFSDDLGAFVPGAVAVGLPASDVCGAGSLLSGGAVITLTGGQLAPLGTCTFDVLVQIPPEAAEGTYVNNTSPLAATIGGLPWTGGAANVASAPLVVGARLLTIPTLGDKGLMLLVILLAGLALYRLRLG